MLIDSNELIGKALGSCTLQRLIGRGGMGAVYLARQARPRRTVAVKVLMPSMITEQKSRAEFLTRFRREADAIAALDHVNIVPVYEYGEQEDIAYLVMPYIPGGTLRDVIEKRHILPLEEVVPIIEQAAAALDSAHKQNIIHRDLKPGNMLFHADGRLLLADFGLAKVLSDSAENSRKQTELTSVGTIIGTPEYLSPEQGTGKALDYRTDVYSLGVVLYQMLAGKVPFTGSTPVAIALKHALEAPPPLKTFNPDISPVVEEVVMKALAKVPDQRYSSAGELARALRDAAKEVAKRTKLQDIKTVVSRPLTTEEVQEEDNQQPGLVDIKEPELKTPVKTPELPPEIVPAPSTPREEEEDTVKEPVEPVIKRIESYETQVQQEGIHADETEATPRVIPAPVAPRPQVYPPNTNHAIYERGGQGQRLQPPEPAVVVRPNVAQMPNMAEIRRPEKRRGLQSVGMMLLGSFLTLIIVVGAVAAYIELEQKGAQHPTNITQNHKATPTISATATPPSTSALPGLAINAPTGGLLYGTTTPGGNCDKQGGTWSNPQNAQITCGQSTSMNDNGQGLVGTFLDTLPSGKTMPGNYIVQVDITVQPHSSGQFGVSFRSQPGQQQRANYLLVDSSSTLNMYEYKDGERNINQVTENLPAQTSLTGTFTVDVLASNDNYTFYVNGTQVGNAISSTYLTGGVGLVVGAGAEVSFKNFEVYSI